MTLATMGLWADSLGRFAANWVGHAPSRQERQAMRALLACDPLSTCPAGVRALPHQGELSKRFLALPDGRIALSGVPDYSPAAVPESSWNRRLAIFWVPRWPQQQWAHFHGDGQVQLIRRGPKQRLLAVQAQGPGRLRILQWAHPHWQVRVRPDQPGAPWGPPLAKGGRDAQGWITVPLGAGRWQVALQHGPGG